MSDSPVLVLGARGKTGRRVVDRLDRLGRPFRAASRSGGTRFDFADRDTWRPALDGAGALYLVPMNEAVPAATVEEFLTAVAHAGVRRVVLLSARGVGGAADPYQEPVELALRATDLEWTILRPAWFAQNFSEGLFLEPILSGELALPAGEGREAFVDVEDIADVATAALTRDGHAGEIYELSGPEPLSFRTALEMISEAAGRRVRYTALETSRFTAALAAQGVPPEAADLVAELLGRIRDGAGERASDDVRRVLGRDPRPFADYVKTAAAAGAWSD
ncbi:NAD(P)H-binding protein [Nonomuraea rhodomycinica]|uniref:NAD(P)H-binding protein n=1 Tax=Nonomuraea rhodomycinica TaxID=1712872 RepID=A0A7Y6IY94_9ACTN|nr:NAD(P)H-binding protein [Nonomuraea rhodomycinica]NUW46228.1 NAD(P)H-binding protein [Nonomuraea rhodomycinica]